MSVVNARWPICPADGAFMREHRKGYWRCKVCKFVLREDSAGGYRAARRYRRRQPNGDELDDIRL